jgi:hypothetical protein
MDGSSLLRPQIPLLFCMGLPAVLGRGRIPKEIAVRKILDVPE